MAVKKSGTVNIQDLLDDTSGRARSDRLSMSGPELGFGAAIRVRWVMWVGAERLVGTERGRRRGSRGGMAAVCV